MKINRFDAEYTSKKCVFCGYNGILFEFEGIHSYFCLHCLESMRVFANMMQNQDLKSLNTE